MAILFDWYEDPKPSNKQQGENGNTLHPRIKYNGSTGTDVLRRRIQERCSLTETDVTAVLDALSHIMGQELAEGRQVHLDGIGYFHPCLTTTEPVTVDHLCEDMTSNIFAEWQEVQPCDISDVCATRVN